MASRPGGAGPSGAGQGAAHRFQERRQERMRGAGTQPAIVARPFSFFGAGGAAAPAAPPAGSSSSSSGGSGSVSRRGTATPRGRARKSIAAVTPARTPSGAGPGAAPLRSALRAGSSSRLDNVSISRGRVSFAPPGSGEASIGGSSDSSSLGGPTTSTPYRARPSTSSAGSTSRAADEAERSDLSEEEPIFATLDEMPSIDSPGGVSIGTPGGVSPASRRAEKSMEQRKRKRQSSPGRVDARAAAGKASGGVKQQQQQQVKKKRVKAPPVNIADVSLTLGDVTLPASRIRAPPTQAERAAMKKRLRNVVRLALGEAAAQRKSGKLTDVDVLWHAVERELREASESQPLAPLARALTEVRRSSRNLFTALSQRASERATLLVQLAAARKRKRTLRTQVWEQRSELLQLRREEEELEKEEKMRREKVETNSKLEDFLQQLSSASVAWR